MNDHRVGTPEKPVVPSPKVPENETSEERRVRMEAETASAEDAAKKRRDAQA